MAKIKAIAPYEVEKFDGKVTRTKYEHKDGQLVSKEVEEDAGYMVYFHKGHSIRVRDKDELKRLNFTEVAKVIDEETGEELEDMVAKPGSVKKRVQNATVSRVKPEPNKNDGE
jgi:hypothetical protein